MEHAAEIFAAIRKFVYACFASNRIKTDPKTYCKKRVETEANSTDSRLRGKHAVFSKELAELRRTARLKPFLLDCKKRQLLC